MRYIKSPDDVKIIKKWSKLNRCYSSIIKSQNNKPNDERPNYEMKSGLN